MRSPGDSPTSWFAACSRSAAGSHSPPRAFQRHPQAGEKGLMELTFFPLTLDAVDQAAAESLCLFVGADERPLTGLAGLVDWRLLARLSRLLRGGQITGDTGEAVLTSPGARLAFRKMFLFGIGPSGQTEEQLQQRVAQGLRKLADAGVRDAALQLPPRQHMFKKKKR